MHTWESTKIEKVSLRRIDANLTFIAKTLNWLSLGINKFFLGAIQVLTSSQAEEIVIQSVQIAPK